MFSLKSEPVHVWCTISLTLSQHVHIALAKINLTSVLLETRDQILVKAHARVLHCGHLSLLLVSLWLLRSLGLHNLLLILGGWLRWCVAVAWTATHHCSYSLMSNFWTCTESHTGSHRWHKSSTHAHTTALLWSCVLLGCLLNWSCCWSSSSGWTWSTTWKHSTTTTWSTSTAGSSTA